MKQAALPFLVLLLFALSPGEGIKAGIPPYHKFNISEGLPSSTVFDVMQDRDGFIWMATLGGVVKFDGIRFMVFKAKDGLNVTSTVALAQRSNGDILFGSYENGISVLRNGKISNYYHDTEGKQFPCSYFFMTNDPKNGELLWSYKNSGWLHPLKDRNGKGVLLSPVITGRVRANRVAVTNGRVLISANIGLYELKDRETLPLKIEGLPEVPLFKIFPTRDGSILIGSKGVIYRIRGNRVSNVYRLKAESDSRDVNELIEDRSGNIWFSLVNGGLYMMDLKTGEEIDLAKGTGLKSSNITSMLEDREGNIWISTYGKGVFCFHNLYITCFNEFDGLSNNIINSVMVTSKGEVVAGTTDGVNILQSGRFFRPPGFSLPAQPEYIYRTSELDNTIITAGVYIMKIPAKFTFNGVNFKLFNRPAFFVRRDGSLWLGMFDNGFQLLWDPLKSEAPQAEMRVFSDSAKNYRVNDIREDKDGNVWLASSKGLCKVSNIKIHGNQLTGDRIYFTDDKVLGYSLRSISIDINGDLWFAGEKGIAVYRSRTDKITSWTKFEGHDLSQATSISFDSARRLWVGTMSGLFVFDKRETLKFHRMNGLPSSEILSLAFDPARNHMYIGTSDGLARFDIDRFYKTSPPKPGVKVTGVHNSEYTLRAGTELEVGPGDRNLRIDFSSLLYSSPGAITYRYSFNGKNDTTENGSISFTNLEPGEHTLTVEAVSDNLPPGTPMKMNIDVLPVFTETFPFRLLLLTIFLLVVFVAVRVRLNSSARKASEKLAMNERINDLKHQALSAMMNPHFLFNSLNSVQYLVNSKRNEDANNYIAMMAQLMRKNLDASANGFILVSEEIERLKLYLELEKMRFSHKFDFQITIGEGIQAEKIQIPNMIIQPFVENSIWHGLADTKSDGLITIHFAMEADASLNNILRIRITDNGIGIANAIKKRNSEHISRGMGIIEERLKLLSMKMEIPKPIVIDDLGEKTIDSSGTEIIISLPEPLFKII